MKIIIASVLAVLTAQVSAECKIGSRPAKCYASESLLGRGPTVWNAPPGALVVADCYKAWSGGDAL